MQRWLRLGSEALPRPLTSHVLRVSAEPSLAWPGIWPGLMVLSGEYAK